MLKWDDQVSSLTLYLEVVPTMPRSILGENPREDTSFHGL